MSSIDSCGGNCGVSIWEWDDEFDKIDDVLDSGGGGGGAHIGLRIETGVVSDCISG